MHKFKSKAERASERERGEERGLNIENFFFQMCCDASFVITSCVAGWPGSMHDSRIFRQSRLCAQFENGMKIKTIHIE